MVRKDKQSGAGGSETLADRAYKILENQIVKLDIEPGSVWSEKELSELAGIGRMPVREAIKKLETAHLVTIMPRRGIIINEIRIEDMLLQMEVRRLLENLIARRASRYATEEQRAKLRTLAKDYEEATIRKDSEKAVDVDDQFNTLIAKASKNSYATSALAPLHASARRLYYTQYKVQPEMVNKINYAHIDLMKAVANGNEDKAAECSDYLLDCVEKLYMEKARNFIFKP
ncbi:GntR family transcriptional regulator [Vallitalea okinawensis]|uniref:GntR family transcriptional regulator n=1 Tax=Vallitalea okinawensis TaxID=2078660 RepID=UPI000CFE113D|nr:GntR family transcriptional regulator [Vallitalea okinawensis]